MTYTVQKTYHFSASHVLDGLAAGHPCGRLHGHNYEVTIAVQSRHLVRPGFVVDFGDLAPIGEWLDASFDHQHLNAILDVNPTSEHLAAYVHDYATVFVADLVESGRCPGDATVRVGVSETPRSWCWVE